MKSSTSTGRSSNRLRRIKRMIGKSRPRRRIRLIRDRKSTRLNSSHSSISYAVFCLKKKNQEVAKRASGFSMRVVAHDPFISERVAADLGVELVAMYDLIPLAYYISLHMPSTPQTKQ